MTESWQRILMGNEALARGLLENGCSMAASYPGTPASEIMGAVQDMARDEKYEMYAEWSINEKVAYENRPGSRVHRRSGRGEHEAGGPERGRRPPS